jgi:DNA-binding transcriptional regulator/RsmH inhibitor MraZ
VLDGDLLVHAGVAEKVRFVGLGDRFQIWAPDLHQPRTVDLLKLALESGDLLDPFEDEEGQTAG